MKKGYFGIGIENMKNLLNLGTLWRSAFALVLFIVNVYFAIKNDEVEEV